MEPDEFRAAGHRLIEWVADYLEQVERYPVLPDVVPGEIAAGLPEHAPEQGEAMDAILDDVDRLVMPGVTHWNHPKFFAYFPANHSPPAILGELVSAALAVNGMVWQSCPSATEVEQVVMDWLRQLCGLPDSFRGVIQDSASSSTLVALLCAREQATGWVANELGLAAAVADQPLRIYASAEAHSSVLKGARVAGFGAANVVAVATDEALAMDPAALQRAIDDDRAAGLRPCAIVATVGTTSSTAIDPLRPIGEIAEAEGLWLHVDAALAGSAAILPEQRKLFDGIEFADSYVFNPHKWLFTNFDCSAYYTRHPDVLEQTMAIDPEYLRTDRDGQVVNLRDWGIALGRRFRALKLWFVLRSYGAEGLRAKLREHLQLAAELAGWIDAHPRFERLAPTPLQTICFRHRPAEVDDAEALDHHNKALLDALNRSGQMYLSHTRIRGRFSLRMSLGQTQMARRHVEQAWSEIQRTAEQLSR